MSARKAAKRIPKLTRHKEAARRMIRALARDLTQGLKSTTKRRTRAGGAKGREFRPNPWPKCPSCFHRVPKLCPFCGEGRNLTEAPKHTAACCPGRCSGTCGRCKNVCQGPCSECGQCNCAGECKDKENAR